MELQEAYKILKVSENASEEEIEQQYMIWIRRHNAKQNANQSDDNSIDIKLISTAYNTIRSFKTNGTEIEQNADSFKDKLNHFFHYYTLHVFGGILLLVILCSILFTFIDKYQDRQALSKLPPENVSVMLLGDYFNPSMDTEPVSENVLTLFPSWKRVSVNLNYFPLDAQSSGEVAMQQKSTIKLVSDESDLYIMGMEHFEKLMKNEMFLALDKMESSLLDTTKKDNLIYRKTKDSNTQQLFGVELKVESVFDGIQVSDDKKVLAIRKDGKNQKNAMKVILELAK